MQFDHAGYRKMAEQGSVVLKAFKLSDMQVVFPNEYTAVLTYKVKQDIQSRESLAARRRRWRTHQPGCARERIGAA